MGLGGDDTISGDADDDIIIAGAADDAVSGDGGDDIIFGDNGTVELVAGAITLLRTTDTVADTGGDDTITGDADDDIIFGGVNLDTIEGNGGNNIIFGDNGFIDYVSIDSDPSDIDVISSTLPSLGDIDTITTGDGNDIIIGGSAGDTIVAGDGDNIVLGDSGSITASDATDTPTLAGHPLTIGLIETINSVVGGGDNITTGIGRDLVLGGAADDIIGVSEGDNIVLGDSGYIDYVSIDSDPSDIDAIGSVDAGIGGVDKITSGDGDDIIIGGSVGDTIVAGDGDNIVLGDSGTITASDATDTPTLAGHPLTIGLIETINSVVGGGDNITTGIGGDLVLGGAADDIIGVSEGDNIVLGDSGYIDYVSIDSDPSDIDAIGSVDAGIGGVDKITSGDGDDIIIGGSVGDTIVAGDGDNIVLGDSGTITASDATDTPTLAGHPLTIGA